MVIEGYRLKIAYFDSAIPVFCIKSISLFAIPVIMNGPGRILKIFSFDFRIQQI